MRPVVVVGAGWSGAVVAQRLTQAGVPVEVLERERNVGGHARVETLNGVVYEPNGAHIFHTSNPRVASLMQRLGVARPYRHKVVAAVDMGEGDQRVLSWPPQVDELSDLPQWPTIERELSDLGEPRGDDLESYVTSMMGRTLYEMFVEGYTWKQWGRDPSELSSAIAPKRIELRRDGDRRLFHDRWEFFPKEGMNAAIERLLSQSRVTCGADVTVEDLPDAAAFVLTGALDDFLERPGELEWRGVRMVSTYTPTETCDTLTPAYVVNHPSPRVPYTRTVETKHATGQLVAGTVVSEEMPGASARHYPVPDADGVNARRNAALQKEARDLLLPTPVYFCGRLSTYAYINQDQAIERAWDCAQEVLASLA